MEAPKLSKCEYTIPVAFLERFKQETRFVLPGNLAGVWIFPPGWIAKVAPTLAKSLGGHSLVAVPNTMLRG